MKRKHYREFWIECRVLTGAFLTCAQDERELKRQRRKQSNRESARRSRLRKQAECEGLAQKVVDLETENAKLKEAVKQLQAQLDAAMGNTAAPPTS